MSWVVGTSTDVLEYRWWFPLPRFSIAGTWGELAVHARARLTPATCMVARRNLTFPPEVYVRLTDRQARDDRGRNRAGELSG